MIKFSFQSDRENFSFYNNYHTNKALEQLILENLHAEGERGDEFEKLFRGSSFRIVLGKIGAILKSLSLPYYRETR